MIGMSPLDVRELLEGYCLDDKTVTVRPVTTVSGSDLVTVEPSGLLPLMTVAGPGIPSGAFIAEVLQGQVRLSAQASASATVQATFTTFTQVSDSWITNTRDLQVIPVVERFTGFPLSGIRRVTEYHSGTGSSLLILNRKPVIEVFSINLITNPQNWIFVSPSSVEPLAEEGILKIRAVLESWQNYVPAFPRGKDNIKVDYTYGYADVPDDIKRAVCMLTASFALGMIGSRTGGGSVGVQGYNRSYGARGKYHDARQELDKWAHAILRRYATGMAGS
jgi:hypothetical protein